MTKRQRVHTAMRRQVPDRVPKEASFTRGIQQLFERETGQTDPVACFDYDVAHVVLGPRPKLPPFAELFSESLPANVSFGEYGTASAAGDFHNYTRRFYIMKGWPEVAQLAEYPWPDYREEPQRFAGLAQQVEQLHQEGWYVKGFCGHIYEVAWQLTSMEKLLCDFLVNPAFAAYLLERITDNVVFAARKLAEAGVDCLGTGDDVGMQDRLMMSPQTWRQWLKPCWRRVFRAAREVNPDIQIWYHSDGNISGIIPDLMEIGLDILNPVQPECMDQAQLKNQYGDRLAFWGCIGTQTTMPFGTPDEVRATIKELIDTIGAGGGLLLAPTHVLEPDVPWENVVAMFEAIDEYGHY